MTDAPANDAAEPTEDDVFEQKAVRLGKRERLLAERTDAAGGPYPVVVPVTDTIPALRERYVSVTPLRLDRTNEAFSEELSATLK